MAGEIESKLREEIMECQKARTEFIRWKIILVAGRLGAIATFWLIAVNHRIQRGRRPSQIFPRRGKSKAARKIDPPCSSLN
jgi:hypothetical protein